MLTASGSLVFLTADILGHKISHLKNQTTIYYDV